MRSDLLAETGAELGLADSAPLAGLAPAQLARLRDAARAARRRQEAALDDSIARALEHVPKLLRAAVKRSLFP